MRVQTNIITGFLGVGKTTMIQHLLKQKPPHERWAILVNEFGEVGIDGSFLYQKDQTKVFVREVPGGCMCCTSGLPMQIALNQLLMKAKPHRLLIEPTGLGHPKEVMDALLGENYKNVLDLNRTLTLVDARKVADKRYREHDIFREQLIIADCIIVTKSDLYTDNEMAELDDYLKTLGIADKMIVQDDKCQSVVPMLNGPTVYRTETSHQHAHHPIDAPMDIDTSLQLNGQVNIANKGQGFYSYGWAFAAQRSFEYSAIMNMLTSLHIERLKAVFITDKGIFAFNMSEGVLSCFELDESFDSRLEFIMSDEQAAQRLVTTLEETIFK
jgi:G3E family GTPase